MYVTAQRVRNEHGDDGVHVFAFVHGHVPVSGVDWSAPDAGFIAEHRPGQLLLAMQQISGERLAIISYLDIAFHDALARNAAQLLRRLVAAWPRPVSWPVAWGIDNVGGRLYTAASGRTGVDEELFVLQDALLPFLGHVVPPRLGFPAAPTPTTRAIIVLRKRTERGYEFRVDQSSRRDLEAAGVPPPHPVVSTSLENYDALEVMTGRDFEDEVVPVLAKLSLDQIDALGGAEVADADTGTTLWVSEGLKRRRKP